MEYIEYSLVALALLARESTYAPMVATLHRHNSLVWNIHNSTSIINNLAIYVRILIGNVCHAKVIHTLDFKGGVMSCSINEATCKVFVCFLKFVAISSRNLESFLRFSMRSDLMRPKNLDVPDNAMLAILATTDGNCVDPDPRCGVARNRIPFTDTRMFSKSSSSSLARMSA